MDKPSVDAALQAMAERFPEDVRVFGSREAAFTADDW